MTPWSLIYLGVSYLMIHAPWGIWPNVIADRTGFHTSRCTAIMCHCRCMQRSTMIGPYATIVDQCHRLLFMSRSWYNIVDRCPSQCWRAIETKKRWWFNQFTTHIVSKNQPRKLRFWCSFGFSFCFRFGSSSSSGPVQFLVQLRVQLINQFWTNMFLL